jgi:Protein of unknown function (DUF4058)
MPMHDWTRVEAGIFHDFHHAWIEEIKRTLNAGLLPDEYYALAEQYAAGFGPDVLTLESAETVRDDTSLPARPAGSCTGGLLVAPPRVALTAETDLEFYRRKQKAVAVRHVSGDRIVAILEIVSPGNKASRNALRSFVGKALELLNRDIHLLVVDPFPPSRRDPQGIHGVIWRELTDQVYVAPEGKPLTLAAYACCLGVKAYVVGLSVGDTLVDMPVFLDAGAHVDLPLEATYGQAFAAVPRRWRRVLEKPA